jgi:hypothetical protein
MIADYQERAPERVELSKIEVDSSYQLPLVPDRVRAIVDDFRPNLFQAVTVNIRDNGRMFLIDGQNRAEAAKLMGFTHVQAWVYRGLTQAQEAIFFLDVNTKRRGYIKAIPRHFAELMALDPRAIAIQAIVDEFGHTLTQTPSKNVASINGIGSLHWLWEMDGGPSLRYVFRTIMDAYPNDNQRWQAPIASTIGQFHYKYPQADQGRLLDVLSGQSARALIIRIHEYHAITVDGVTVSQGGFFISQGQHKPGAFTMSGVEVLRKLYNHRLRSEGRRLS